MVGPEGDFALIDYDGVWLEGLPQSMMEVAIPTTSTCRLEADTVTVGADVFPGFVIYVSLKALAAEPKLWDEFHSGENLIFAQEDFVGIDKADRTIWSRLSGLDDEHRLSQHAASRASRVAPDSFSSVRAMAEEGEESFSGATKYIVDRSSRSTAGSWWGPTWAGHVGVGGDGRPSGAGDGVVHAGSGRTGRLNPCAGSSRVGRPEADVGFGGCPSSGDTKLRVLAIVPFLLGIIVMTIAVVLVVSG